jgi:hypothetical protein
MKHLFIISLLFVAALWSMDLSAQQVVKKRIGTYIESGNVVVAEANTTLAVDLTVEIEHFVAGPYARYAESMLHTQARLTDNVTYRLVSTNVGLVEDNTHLLADEATNYGLGTPCCEEFSEFTIDRLSSEKQELKERAKAAADRIYALRTARIELITAEFGDGVYGAGLESALREIDRLEKEYTELFLGKRSTSTHNYRYYIPIKPAEFEKVEPTTSEEGAATTDTAVAEPKMLPQSYIVARFGERIGVVASDNLAGEILLLTINPTEMSYPESNIKGKVTYRYANNAEITLSLGQDIISKRTLPIYEFGRTVTILAPTK